MSERELAPTEGGRELARYLRTNGLSISRFSEMNGLDRVQVQRAIKGVMHRFSVDFAISIERATVGSVLVSQWASETARPIRRRPAA